jgi:predicted  nucleic acid-binding Zn-ribbon protein
MVISGAGKIVYPADFVSPPALPPAAPARVAADNYPMVSAGLRVKTAVKIGYNTLISAILLACYLLISVLLLFVHYKKAAGRIYQAQEEKRKEVERLRVQEKEKTERIETLAEERQRLKEEYDRLQKALTTEKNRAQTNENDMIDEIVTLEEQLARNIARQDARQTEIEALKEKLKQYEKSRHKGDAKKARAAEALKKRFSTLYKNIAVHERAVSGFAELNEELKIKAEEVIHQLNADSSKVTIKRKVFGRKGHQTVLEVIFAYKGRLYFRKQKDNRIEVLAIGTKNTQARELEFLSRL